MILRHGDEIALGSTRARYDDGHGPPLNLQCTASRTAPARVQPHISLMRESKTITRSRQWAAGGGAAAVARTVRRRTSRKAERHPGQPGPYAAAARRQPRPMAAAARSQGQGGMGGARWNQLGQPVHDRLNNPACSRRWQRAGRAYVYPRTRRRSTESAWPQARPARGVRRPSAAARRSRRPAELRRNARRRARLGARHRHADRRGQSKGFQSRTTRSRNDPQQAPRRLRAPPDHVGAHARHRSRARPRTSSSRRSSSRSSSS